MEQQVIVRQMDILAGQRLRLSHPDQLRQGVEGQQQGLLLHGKIGVTAVIDGLELEAALGKLLPIALYQ